MGSSTAKMASIGKGIRQGAVKGSERLCADKDDRLAVDIKIGAVRKSRSAEMCEALDALEGLSSRIEALHARICDAPTDGPPDLQVRHMSLAEVLSEGPDIVRAQIGRIENTLASIEDRLF